DPGNRKENRGAAKTRRNKRQPESARRSGWHPGRNRATSREREAIAERTTEEWREHSEERSPTRERRKEKQKKCDRQRRIQSRIGFQCTTRKHKQRKTE